MGFKKPFLYLLALSIFSMASLAIAADFDPRRVILLPKSDNNGPRTLEDIKKQQDDAKKEKKSERGASRGRNDNIIVVPKQATPLPSGPVALPNQKVGGQKELSKNELALTQAYSKHLYSSICAQNYRDELAPRSEKNLDMKRMWADIQASCKCLSEQILASVPPAELSDYVMFTYGWQSPTGPEDAEFLEYDKSGKSDRISDIVTNQQIRKKCGFLN